jgi:hypothetical protein
VTQGGLLIDAARKGTHDLILIPYGAVAAFLLSDPVQFLLAAQALKGNAARLWFRWFGRSSNHDDWRNTPLQEAVQIYEFLDEFIYRQVATDDDDFPAVGDNTSPTTPENAPTYSPTHSTLPDVEIVLQGRRAVTPHRVTLAGRDTDGNVFGVEVSED